VKKLGLRIAFLVVGSVMGVDRVSYAQVVAPPTNPSTAVAGAGEIRLFSVGTMDGRQFEYVVRKEAFAGMLEWRPENQDPPLPLPRAIGIAKRAACIEHPEFEDLELTDVRIASAQAYKNEKRWYYAIGLWPVLKGQLLRANQVTVVVLMDGTVVMPVEKKRSLPRD
jgi:hypothetical protein